MVIVWNIVFNNLGGLVFFQSVKVLLAIHFSAILVCSNGLANYVVRMCSWEQYSQPDVVKIHSVHPQIE